MAKKHYSEEDRLKLWEQIQERRNEGASIASITKEFKIATGTYQSWRDKYEGVAQPKTKVVVHESEDAEYKPRLYNKRPKATGKALVIVTDISSLAQVLKELA